MRSKLSSLPNTISGVSTTNTGSEPEEEVIKNKDRRVFLVTLAALFSGCRISPKERERLIQGAAISLLTRMQKICERKRCKPNEEYELDIISTESDLAGMLGPLDGDVTEQDVIAAFNTLAAGEYKIVNLEFNRESIDNPKVVGLKVCKFKLVTQKTRAK